MMMKMTQRLMVIMLCALLVVSATGCARSVNPETGYKAGIHDPLEPVNRGVFAFNNVLDQVIINPICRVYNAIFPNFVRDGIQNFMRNISSPIIVANELLQGDVRGAGVATARFVINTTAGIGGLFDPAGAHGLQYDPEDFGQTLGVWGFGDGFYIVLPVIGPSSLRDATGMLVDGYADPVRLWAHNTHRDWIYYTRVGVDGLDKRARIMKAMNDLRRNSLDYYAAVRSAYAQKRQALIRDEKPGTVDIPDYDAAATPKQHD
jgi:phospholipid-binding lipoprotein MlaA